MKKIVMVVVCLMTVVNISLADNIRGINIDFVTIGNAGNAADTTGYGAVGYNYNIGKYEVTNAQWNAYDQSTYFTSAQQPINMISWQEMLQFCNYLTSGDKSKGVYQFSGNNTNPGNFLGIDRFAAKMSYGTIYFLPTENEWYKAAYYKPNGSGYSIYANGLNTIPAADNGWNYRDGLYSPPWNVGTGTMEQNGTFDMMGNVWEWNETVIVSNRGLRGGSYGSYDPALASSYRDYYLGDPYAGSDSVGFRVVSVPEPATLSILVIGFSLLRRKQTH